VVWKLAEIFTALLANIGMGDVIVLLVTDPVRAASSIQIKHIQVYNNVPSILSPSMAALPLKADSHIAFPAHAVPIPRPCRAAKGLECVLPI
jgi:hypothetical protein